MRLAIALIILIPACAAPERGGASKDAGFVDLFDGATLAGWWGCGTEDPRAWQALAPEQRAAKRLASLPDIARHWRIENGELINDGDGLYLTTERDFGDFELTLEYRTVPLADSGIYLRGCPQVQIWDPTEEAKRPLGADRGSGGLWNNSPGAPGKDPLVRADAPFGEWNRVRVLMAGEIVSVWLNDRLVVDRARLENYFDRAAPLPDRGPIQLQTHGGEIRWRRIRIRELNADEASRLRSVAP